MRRLAAAPALLAGLLAAAPEAQAKRVRVFAVGPKFDLVPSDVQRGLTVLDTPVG